MAMMSNACFSNNLATLENIIPSTRQNFSLPTNLSFPTNNTPPQPLSVSIQPYRTIQPCLQILSPGFDDYTLFFNEFSEPSHNQFSFPDNDITNIYDQTNIPYDTKDFDYFSYPLERHMPFDEDIYHGFQNPIPSFLPYTEDYFYGATPLPFNSWCDMSCAKYGGQVTCNEIDQISNYRRAQSISSRERRRKIKGKTGELGKLVPGGSKMNTAEMLRSAFKYIKFLKAQLGMLQFISSSLSKDNLSDQTTEEVDENGGQNEQELKLLARLLGSTEVEEKLYSQEKCLCRRSSLEDLTKHPCHPLNSSTLYDIDLLITQSNV